MQRNGATVAYADTGPPVGAPDAATIVFGHGLLFGGWMFRAQVEALRGHYRCVSVDWRGQGASPASEGGYDMDSLCADAVGLIRDLDVAPVHWVGLSMGGFVGLRIAARHGELLRSLSLLDTSADPEEPRAARQDRLLALAYSVVGAKSLLMRQVLPIMFGPTFRSDPANSALIEEFVERLGRCDRAGIRRATLAVANRSPVYAEIDRITVPTQVIVGADDVPTPVARSRRIAERIPGAMLHIVPDSGHSSSVEQPQRITALLAEFLSALD